MDELQSPKSKPSANSSFESLRLSGNQYNKQYPEQNDQYEAIEEIDNIEFMPEKTLTESFRETYKMCCSGIRTMKTNLAYSLKHSNLDVFGKRQKVVLDKNQTVTFLGKIYQNNSKDKYQFYLDFSNTIWLTYRKGIYGVQSDAGWGCMIRVCQMVLAEAFKRLSPSLPLNNIISHFRDTPEAYFSLTRICEKGNINERWTSSIQIFTLFKQFLSSFPFLNLNLDLHSSCVQISSLKELESISYPSLVFISNRLGKFAFEKQYKDHLLDVMKVPYFVGVVGGSGGEALYLIGQYCEKVIFMDPHFVQSYEEEEEGKQTSTYFQSQPYCIDINELAPSVAFNFLVKSKEQYQSLLRDLYEIQTKHQPFVCFEIVSDEIKKDAKKWVQKDDFFEVIE